MIRRYASLVLWISKKIAVIYAASISFVAILKIIDLILLIIITMKDDDNNNDNKNYNYNHKDDDDDKDDEHWTWDEDDDFVVPSYYLKPLF